MAFYDTTWYCNYGNGTSTGYYAVTVRPQNTAVAAGVLRRQFTTPSVNNERVFVCIVAGTTANTTDATWTLTRGSKTTDGTATWMECTGVAALNGDATNTVNWTQAKATGSPSLGTVIQRNNGASYWICTAAGGLGAAEPAWANDTAGTTQTDNSATWTCLGVVGNFTGGQAPHARLQNACASTWFTAGNTIYVGDNHAETQSGSINYGPSGNLTTSSKILCHNHSGSYPPTSLTTGAAVTVTGSFVGYTFNPAGQFYIYGLTYNAGSGANACYIQISPTSGAYTYFDNCLFAVTNTATSQSYIQVGAGSGGNSNILWNNCTVKFGATAQYIAPGYTWFVWQNTGQVLSSGSVPTSFFTFAIAAAASVNQIIMEALDLSQLTGALCAYNTAAAIGTLLVKDCKLNGSMTIPTPDNPGSPIQLVHSDSSATGYKSARYAYDGTETTETTITRVGGAADPTGQAQSRKIVTTANSVWNRPFRAEPYAIWNSTTGANVTVTVCGTVNSASLPNNDDIWIEIEYLGSSSFPLGTLVTTTKSSVLASNAAVASDGSTWNGGGSGAGWSPFKLTMTLSSPQPGFAGYIYARVRAAKASTTYYIDPLILLS